MSAPAIAPSPVGPLVVDVTITNASCVPDRSSVPAGPVIFHVTNESGDRVSEIELTQDGRILGEDTFADTTKDEDAPTWTVARRYAWPKRWAALDGDETN